MSYDGKQLSHSPEPTLAANRVVSYSYERARVQSADVEAPTMQSLDPVSEAPVSTSSVPFLSPKQQGKVSSTLLPTFLSSAGAKANPVTIQHVGEREIVTVPGQDVYDVMNADDDGHQYDTNALCLPHDLPVDGNPSLQRQISLQPPSPNTAEFAAKRWLDVLHRPSGPVTEDDNPRPKTFAKGFSVNESRLQRFRDELDRCERRSKEASTALLDPQSKTRMRSAYVIWVICLCNLFSTAWYMYWRWNKTYPNSNGEHGTDEYAQPIPGVDEKLHLQREAATHSLFGWWWWWSFFIVEAWLFIGIFIGHTQRLFPCNRLKVTMDELVAADKEVGDNALVTIMVPTAGEKLSVVLSALLGASSQKLWKCELTDAEMCRVLVLDEKRRQDVFQLVCWTYDIARLIYSKPVQNILLQEGLKRICPKQFYDWCNESGGFMRRHLYENKDLNKAVFLVRKMDLLVTLVESSGKNGAEAVLELKNPEDYGLYLKPEGTWGENLYGVYDLLKGEMGEVPIRPGFFQVFSDVSAAPIMTYYSRINAGTPKVSPKAGNMNSAIFSLDYPDQEPFIGSSTIVVVNDCRHQLEPHFLQSTVPYFFKLNVETSTYEWANVAFVQTPQRFRKAKTASLEDDPLGNEAAVQYDVINMGKDGIGAVSSSGQGSLWRVEALKGVRPSGAVDSACDDLTKVGKKVGFRSELLIEDTHTSIEIFRMGWRSVYINQPNDVLAWCTHQPDNIIWRMKQVLRWHQGAAQLFLFKSLLYNVVWGRYPTIWHRIYVLDQTTYYLLAFPGYMLLLFPMIYAVSGVPPFSTNLADYFIHFVPVVLTAMAPTAVAASWRTVNSSKLNRDEQIWLSTTYIQMYAFLQTVYSFVTCRGRSNAWTAAAPIFPLFLVFFSQIVAIFGGAARYFQASSEDAKEVERIGAWMTSYVDDLQVDRFVTYGPVTVAKDPESFAPHFLAILVSAVLAMYALWPMIALQMKWKMPPVYYTKMLVWAALGCLAIFMTQANINLLPSSSSAATTEAPTPASTFAATIAATIAPTLSP